MTRRGIGAKLAAVVFAAALLLLWQYAAEQHFISPVFFPTPTRTFAALVAMEERGDLWGPMEATCVRMFYGWVIASLIGAGVALGAAIARSSTSRGPISSRPWNSSGRCRHRPSFRPRSCSWD